MKTEFTKLNHSIITPLLKSKGYKKIGPYSYGATFDKAVYKKQNLELNIIYSVHPYDYPELGVRLIVLSKEAEIFSKLYPVQEGGLPVIIESLAKDLRDDKIYS